MKRPLLLLAVLPILAQSVQLLDDTPVDKFRIRTETTFRNDHFTGDLVSVQINTVDVWKQGTNVLFSQPGPTLMLTPAQLAASITNFAAVQAAFATLANQFMTNQP